jgi:hypothetical protein
LQAPQTLDPAGNPAGGVDANLMQWGNYGYKETSKDVHRQRHSQRRDGWS